MEFKIVQETKDLVKKENEIIIQILKNILKIEKSKIHLKLGFKSLHEFVVKELGYSEAAAWRRIESMRLMKLDPTVEEKISSGTLSLTNAARLNTFLKNEKRIAKKTYSITSQKLLINDASKLSTRELEAKLSVLSPKIVKKEQIRPVNQDKQSLFFYIANDQMKKLERIKALASNKLKSTELEEVFNFMLDKTLEVLEKKSPKEKAKPKSTKSLKSSQIPVLLLPQIPTSAAGENKIPRYINYSLRQEVLKNANYQCQYVCSSTGKRCSQKYYLEIDHIRPKFKNGTNNLNNLQVLCSAHNKLKSCWDPKKPTYTKIRDLRPPSLNPMA